MDKNESIRVSNWAGVLDEDQVWYAVMDAWGTREVFVKLFQRYANAESSIKYFAEEFTDREKPVRIRSSAAGGDSKIASRQRRPTAIPARKSPIYDCIIQDPSGEVLCICIEKKLQWYLDHDLACKVAESTDGAAHYPAEI